MSRYFGGYGGMFVPETLVAALQELDESYRKLKNDSSFKKELDGLLRDYAGRETPLYLAKRLSEHVSGTRIYLKREDLLHTGTHKINNSIGQALLAKKMGKERVIAATGSGQHGIATAAAAAILGLECTVYMGAADAKRQEPNLSRMEAVGAEVSIVKSGSKKLKDAIDEAMRDHAASFRSAHHLVGSAIGPYPYPGMVRDFQCVIGTEARAQILKKEGRLPDFIVSCVGGGSAAIGLFHPFLKDNVRKAGVEAGGDGKTHAERLTGKAKKGVVHGMMTYMLQDGHGQAMDTCSVSAGLDYCAVGPEHAFLKDSAEAEYFAVKDDEALDAFRLLSETEGITPSLESAHAVAQALKIAKVLEEDRIVIVGLSGRGETDLARVKGPPGGKK